MTVVVVIFVSYHAVAQIPSFLLLEVNEVFNSFAILISQNSVSLQFVRGLSAPITEVYTSS